MSDAPHLKFDRAPNILGAYAAALKPKKQPRSEVELPRIQATLKAIAADQKQLNAYRKLCGFSDLEHIPISFPHIMAFPLHMKLLTHQDFPMKTLGMVHLRNRTQQVRKIRNAEPLNFNVQIRDQRRVNKGLEFDVSTDVTDDHGDPVSMGLSTFLSRLPALQPDSKKPDPVIPEFEHYELFRAPANIGRRYSRVSGDVNPIHMSLLSARLFGFKRAIAHGMWTMSVCAGKLEQYFSEHDAELSVAFKLPVFLPSRLKLGYTRTDSGISFGVVSEDSSKLHLIGNIN